jgi:hypothetical protein
MTIHAEYRRGQLVYYDRYRQRIVDAVGTLVRTWELRASDLQATGGTGTDPRGYTTTMVEAGAGTSEVEASDEAGFVAELVTDTFDNDGLNMQAVGEAFRPTGRDVYFGIALQADEATQSDFFVGLSITTTDALGGVTDSLSFRKLDGATAIGCFTEKDSTETATAGVHTFAANTTVTLELYYDGTSVRYFVNGTQVAQHTTNIPDDEALSPIIQWLAGSANAKRMKVAWARAFAIG